MSETTNKKGWNSFCAAHLHHNYSCGNFCYFSTIAEDSAGTHTHTHTLTQTIANIPTVFSHKCVINSTFFQFPHPDRFLRIHFACFSLLPHSSLSLHHQAIRSPLIFHLKWMMCAREPRWAMLGSHWFNAYVFTNTQIHSHTHIHTHIRRSSHRWWVIILSSKKKNRVYVEKEMCKHALEHESRELLIEFLTQIHQCACTVHSLTHRQTQSLHVTALVLIRYCIVVFVLFVFARFC